MTDITIPPAVVEAGAMALCLAQGFDWDRHPDFHDAWRKEARAAIAAALNAWPGYAKILDVKGSHVHSSEKINLLILFLPKEARDD
jgi:hypothetical protein